LNQRLKLIFAASVCCKHFWLLLETAYLCIMIEDRITHKSYRSSTKFTKSINPYFIHCDKTTITNTGVRVMVFNVTFNNISVISWQSILLVKETGVLGENHQPNTQILQIIHKIYQIHQPIFHTLWQDYYNLVLVIVV
jgi:hypothetical protein